MVPLVSTVLIMILVKIVTVTVRQMAKIEMESFATKTTMVEIPNSPAHTHNLSQVGVAMMVLPASMVQI